MGATHFLKGLYGSVSKVSTADFTARATSFHGYMYGDILIGNKAFEFYGTKNLVDYICDSLGSDDHGGLRTHQKHSALPFHAAMVTTRFLRDNKATL